MAPVLMCFFVLLMCLAVQVHSIPVHGSWFEPSRRPYSKNGQIPPQNKKAEMTELLSENLENIRELPRDAYVHNRVQFTLEPESGKGPLTNSRTKSPRRLKRSVYDLFKAPAVDQEITNIHLTKCTDFEEIHYCHNGGKCAYIPQLELKTCRYPHIFCYYYFHLFIYFVHVLLISL